MGPKDDVAELGRCLTANVHEDRRKTQPKTSTRRMAEQALETLQSPCVLGNSLDTELTLVSQFVCLPRSSKSDSWDGQDRVLVVRKPQKE